MQTIAQRAAGRRVASRKSRNSYALRKFCAFRDETREGVCVCVCVCVWIACVYGASFFQQQRGRWEGAAMSRKGIPSAKGHKILSAVLNACKFAYLGFLTPGIRIRCQNSIIIRSFGNSYILQPSGNMYLIVQDVVVLYILLTLKLVG